ncbi:hypothetical protein [Streptomyces sp. TP-A0874]|uniref:hypothetical protein n=1 Tax=Streptomyces sp. TP-A0874 TaxID=549819 RepID=UPI000852B43C|nr:hypothetical protein [Streptomyces sp. TP-A0874]
MLGFDDVLNVRLGALDDAVSDWTATVKRLRHLAEEDAPAMRRKSDQADWKGENAAVTKPFVRKTVKEFDDALKEATSIRNILRDAKKKFAEHRTALQNLIEEAPEHQVHIDARGTVRSTKVQAPLSADYWQNTPALAPQHTDDKAVTAMAGRIKKVLEAATHDDELVAEALNAIVGDNTHDFTNTGFANLKDAQAYADAQTAAELANKISTEGTAPNLEELRQLGKLMDTHSGDPIFATNFYRAMGAEGSLEFYANAAIDSSTLGDQTRQNLIRNIQNDMGTMLGIASDKDTAGHLDQAWVNDLLKAGHKELDIHMGDLGTQVYGHQALASIIRNGEYDPDFLVQVGRDMVGMDHNDPEVWYNTPTNKDIGLNFDESSGRGFYPFTGLMEALANNPAAATEFFSDSVRTDSNGDGIYTDEDDFATVAYDSNYDGTISPTDKKTPLSIVDFMLDKDPLADARDYSSDGEPQPAQRALGNALEAAVEKEPSGAWSEEYHLDRRSKADDIMFRVVDKIASEPSLLNGKEPGSPGPLTGLAKNFGNMAAAYMPEMQLALEDVSYLTDKEKPPPVFDEPKMQTFLTAVAQHPGAYGTITAAQEAYTNLLIRDAVDSTDDPVHLKTRVEHAVKPGAQIAGIINEARSAAIHEKILYDQDEYNAAIDEKIGSARSAIELFTGKYIEKIPGGESLIDEIEDAISKRAYTDESERAAEEHTKEYLEPKRVVKNSVVEALRVAAINHKMSDEDFREITTSASVAAGQAYTEGSADAAKSRSR